MHKVKDFRSLKTIVCTVTPLKTVGVGRGADRSLTGFHPVWDKILSQIYRPSPTKDVT
jgi:hypothetical protein